VEEALKLFSAFDEMKLAHVIESTRPVDIKQGRIIGFFQEAEQEATKHLDTAFAKLTEVDLALSRLSEVR
jgi:hypothetical protein